MAETLPMAALAASSGTVTLGAGVYDVDAGLLLSPDLVIRGAGIGQTILRAVAPMPYLVHFSAPSMQVVRGGLADLTLDGNGQATFTAYLGRIARFDWTRVHVRCGAKVNIFCAGVVFGRFTRVESVSSYIGWRFGSDSHPTNPEYCRLTTLDHCVIAANQYGLAAEESAGLVVRANIEGNEIPFEFSRMCPAGEPIAVDLDGSWLERNARPGRVHAACHTAARHRLGGASFLDQPPAIAAGVAVEWVA